MLDNDAIHEEYTDLANMIDIINEDKWAMKFFLSLDSEQPVSAQVITAILGIDAPTFEEYKQTLVHHKYVDSVGNELLTLTPTGKEFLGALRKLEKVSHQFCY